MDDPHCDNDYREVTRTLADDTGAADRNSATLAPQDVRVGGGENKMEVNHCQDEVVCETGKGVVDPQVEGAVS